MKISRFTGYFVVMLLSAATVDILLWIAHVQDLGWYIIGAVVGATIGVGLYALALGKA